MKLGSVIRFLKFLEDCSIFAGFKRAELAGTQQFLCELKTGLTSLIIERSTKIRENKSKVFLSPDIFKEYGSSEYIQEIHTFLKALNIAPLNTKINIQTAIHI